MKTKKKLVLVGVAVLLLTIGTATAFATSKYTSPDEAIAGLTERDLQSIIQESNETGKSYGTIAKEAGLFDEFKAEMLAIKKDKLDAQVEDGKISQEQADAILTRMEVNQANCDGSGTGYGMKGAGFGKGKGQGQGQGGHGMGKGLRNGLRLKP